MMTRAEHNDSRWLDVRWLESPRGLGYQPGWYVLRTCPCHRDHPVIWRPLSDQPAAERVRRIILGEETGPSGGPRLVWTGPRDRPPPVVGQIWRRTRGGHGHLKIVSEPDRDGFVDVVSVSRNAAGCWRRVPGKRSRRAAVRRFCNGYNYVWIR